MELPNRQSVPVHPTYTNGPFLKKNHKALPSNYILTKTHCSYQIIDNAAYFAQRCVSSIRVIPTKTKRGRGASVASFKLPKTERLYYNISIVSRVVHLMRNPFDNVIARFNNFNKKNETHRMWLYNHPEQHVANFREWCVQRDEMMNETEQLLLRDKGVPKSVPCASEIFRYVKWHNNAFELTEELGLLVQVLYYEDFGRDYEGILEGLLDFLGLERVGTPLAFATHEYIGFFSEKEKVLAASWIKELASEMTWEHLKAYSL